MKFSNERPGTWMKEPSPSVFTKTPVIVLTAVIATLLWGSAYPCIKIGYETFAIPAGDIPAKLLFAGWRFTAAGILTILFACVVRRRLVFPKKKNLWNITALGLLQTALQYVFFYIGLAYTTGVKGSILNAAGVFIAVLLAHFIYQDDKLTVPKALGCLIGFSGIVIINLGGLDSVFSLMGEGFIILAAASFAVGSLLNKRAAKNDDAAAVTGYQLLIGGAALLLSGILSGGVLPRIIFSGLLLLGYMAVLSAAAFTLWTFLLKYNPVGKISVYNFLVPVFGTLLSALFLGEKVFSPVTLSALLLVCIGIAIVNRPQKKSSKH